MEKPCILVSACLLGMNCRYNGKGELNRQVLELSRDAALIPFCPEIYGGLATPRDPAERQGERVMTAAGADVTEQYKKGAEEALRLARVFECRAAVLKERSPSCGRGQIYDGTYTRRLISGDGVTAQLLEQEKIPVLERLPAANAGNFWKRLKQGKNKKNKSSYRRDEKTVI